MNFLFFLEPGFQNPKIFLLQGNLFKNVINGNFDMGISTNAYMIKQNILFTNQALLVANRCQIKGHLDDKQRSSEYFI